MSKKTLGPIMTPRFPDTDRQKILDFIIKYMVEEDFKTDHLSAIAKIVSFFNEDEQTESNIFGFADRLKKDGSGVEIFVGNKTFSLKVENGSLNIPTERGTFVVETDNATFVNIYKSDQT